MHVIRRDVVEQALVVGHQHTGIVGREQCIHAASNKAQRINVQTRIRFIKDGELGFEYRHLQDFIALFFAARETIVHAAIEKALVHLQQLHLFAHVVVEFQRIEFILAARALHGVIGQTQETTIGLTRNFHGILKTQEQTGARALLGEELKIPDIDTIWCGTEWGRKEAMARLDQSILRDAFDARPLFSRKSSARLGADMSVEERERLLTRMKCRGETLVLQEISPLGLAPVFEELVFRGFLFPLVAEYAGPWAAILLTAIPFALLHGAQYSWAWQQIIIIGIAGFVFGLEIGRAHV